MPKILPYNQDIADEYYQRYGNASWRDISDWEMSRRLIAQTKEKDEIKEARARKATTFTNKAQTAESRLGGKKVIKKTKKAKKTNKKAKKSNKKTARKY